jgi:integrase
VTQRGAKIVSSPSRRPRGAGSISQLDSHRYRLRTRIKDPGTGIWRPVTEIFHGTSAESEIALHKFMARVHGTDHHGTSVTFAGLLDRWLEHKRPRLQWSTWSKHETQARVHLIPALGVVPLRELTASHLDQLYERLVATLEPSTVRKVHDTALGSLHQAVRWGWISVNPAALASPPTVHSKPPVAADDADLERFLTFLHVEDPRLAMVLDILADIGCRPAELCAIRWQDLDLTAGLLTISGSISREPGSPRKPTKTYRDRRIALSEHTVTLLRRHQADTGIITPAAYVLSDVPDHALPLPPLHLTNRLTYLRRKAGITSPLTMRSLRHYVATKLIGAGVDVVTVAGRLGHINPAITLNVYASFLPGNDRAAADLLADMRKRGTV